MANTELLLSCCLAVFARYREIMKGDERDGTALYCPGCQSRLVVAVAIIDEHHRSVGATRESAS